MRKHTDADRAFQAVTRHQWGCFALNSKLLTPLQPENIAVGGVA